MRNLVGLVVVLAVAASAPADVLWDNNIKPNGVNGRAISPPLWPNIRVADDFVVPDGKRWIVEDIHYTAIEDAAWVWNDGDGIEVFVYEDTDGSGPGKLIETRMPGGSKVATGETLFGRAVYEYWAEFEDDPVMLGPGTYWIGARHPTARGGGTNYWLTSDGGPDGGENGTNQAAYFSLNSGTDWIFDGPTFHHAFLITGVPEPTSLALLALGAVAALRRRTRL